MKKLLFGAIGAVLSLFPPPSTAGQCGRGQYWQTTTSSCASCGAHAVNCMEMILEADHCMNTTGSDISLPTVLFCAAGYYNVGYNTADDVANCNNSTTGRATRQRCDPCPSGCSSCSSSSTCTACEDGYTLQNGKCVEKVACPANCAECSNSGTCTKCDSGYKLKNGACEAGSVISCPDDMRLSADGCCCVSQ